jgi:hypothetical protein
VLAVRFSALVLLRLQEKIHHSAQFLRQDVHDLRQVELQKGKILLPVSCPTLDIRHTLPAFVIQITC